MPNGKLLDVMMKVSHQKEITFAAPQPARLTLSAAIEPLETPKAVLALALAKLIAILQAPVAIRGQSRNL